MEGFGHNYESINNNEGIKEQNISSFNYVENNIKQNYENNSKREGSEELALKQYQEQQQLKEQKESPILQEAREGLDKEAMINEAKTMLYEKLGIDENQNNNSSFENFEKGIVDELILNNYDLAIQVWKTNGKIILDGLSQLASWEGLKQIAEAIGESFWSLLTGNAYEKGKAVAELGLIGTGVGIGVYVGKKTVKLGMKEISKLKVNKERLVQSTEMKTVVGETNNKVSEIIPKKQLDFEKAVVEDIAKLGDKDRIDAGKFYLQKDITPEQQEAIIKAHNVGKDRDGAGIYNYNQAEITEKVRILKDAGFDKGERKVLLEKGVCGKEKGINEDLLIKELQNRKETKEYYTKLDRLGLTDDFIKSIEKSGIWGSEKLGITERYEKINKQISDYFDSQSKGEIKIGEEIEFKNFNDFINKRLNEVNNEIKDGPKLTKTEANLIFSLTDNFLFNNLNTFLGGKGDRYNKLINSLNEVEIDGVEKLVKEIDLALSKMPDLKPGEGGFILRGDKVEFWKNKKGEVLNVGDTNELKIFSFCANDIDDTFIGKNGKDTAVYVIGKEGRIKDITKFSLGVNFGGRVIDKEKVPRTYNEGIILRNSDLYVDNKEIIGDTYRFDTTQTK